MDSTTRNARRAKRALKALCAYAPGFTKNTPEDRRDAFADLLTDFRHLAQAENLDLYALLDISYQHYIAELKGEE